MMVDTSAIVAIALAEQGWEELAGAIENAWQPFTTPVVEIEAAAVLATRRTISVARALQAVQALLSKMGVAVRPLSSDVSQWAAEAYDRYGKGRHPARLNFGDCLSYGAARAAGVGLIYKGDDFSQTDLPPLALQG